MVRCADSEETPPVLHQRGVGHLHLYSLPLARPDADGVMAAVYSPASTYIHPKPNHTTHPERPHLSVSLGKKTLQPLELTRGVDCTDGGQAGLTRSRALPPLRYRDRIESSSARRRLTPDTGCDRESRCCALTCRTRANGGSPGSSSYREVPADAHV